MWIPSLRGLLKERGEVGVRYDLVERDDEESIDTEFWADKHGDSSGVALFKCAKEHAEAISSAVLTRPP